MYNARADDGEIAEKSICICRTSRTGGKGMGLKNIINVVSLGCAKNG